MAKKPRKTPQPQPPDLGSRDAAWNKATKMFAIEHAALVNEAALRQALLEGVAGAAANAGLDLKAATAQRAAAFAKVADGLQPFLTGPGKGKK
jgi:uncharacterized membrane protein